MHAETGTFDSTLFRAVMGRFATGVTVISYRHDGAPTGMTANAFLSVSLSPALVLVAVRRASQFVEHVKLGSRYGVNLLAEDQQVLSSHYGGRRQEGLVVDFFETLGTPLIQGSLAHVVARVVDIHGAGDHLLFIAEVEHIARGVDTRPLIFYGGRYKKINAYEPSIQWHSADGW